MELAGRTKPEAAAQARSAAEVGERARELLGEARGVAESRRCRAVERADLIFRLGVCRYKLSSIATASALLDEAMFLAERSNLPCDRLRALIRLWRSRCYRRQRDYLA